MASIEKKILIEEVNMARNNNNYKILKIFLIIAFVILGFLSWEPVPYIDAALETDKNYLGHQDQQIEEQEILPQTERQKNLNPFAGPLKLTGVLISSNTLDNLAILESNNRSYIVRHGDIIDDYWTVEKIEKSSVVLKADNRKLILDKGLSANSESQGDKLEPGNIYLSVEDSDIRDVLSIIAINMDCSVIFLEEPVNLSFEVNNVEAVVALELILQKNNFSFIKNKDIIIAGEVGNLHQKFFDHMILTRFDLKYISSEQ